MTRPAPRLTAILSCRNAAETLGACLDHLAFHGAEVIVIDNGSTDDSREIARERIGKPVLRIVEDPYRGSFDLTRQLRLKARLIAEADTGWIIHADADEFLESPDGGPLSEYLRYWDASDVVAFDCEERLFLPTDETERHAPGSFRDTMRASVKMVERDRKQRLFRASAPLGRWFATGGHTITGVPGQLAPVALELRHYFGLSLDRIRADYLGRVFSARDLAKYWHGNRLGSGVEVVPPEPGLLAGPASVTSVPVLRRRTGPASAPEPAGPVDLWIWCFTDETAGRVETRLADAIPDLRVARALGAARPEGRAPVLAIHEHPGRAGVEDALKRAEAWLRFSAAVRQAAAVGLRILRELRIEDIDIEPGILPDEARRVLIERRCGGPRAFEAIRTSAPVTPRLLELTGALAADLGYAVEADASNPATSEQPARQPGQAPSTPRACI